MQKFPIQTLRSKQNNHRELECMEIVCMYCSSSSKCRRGFVSLSLTILYLHNCRRGLLLSKWSPGKKKSQGIITMSGINSTSLNQHTKFFPTLSAVRGCSKWAQMSRGSTFLSQYLVRNQDHVHIVLRWHRHSGMLNHISGVEWSQFSSATRLGAFLTSLKAAQVISCPSLNPFHLLQLYWQLLQQKQGLFGRIKCPAFLDVLQAFWRLREQELLNHTSRICYQEIHSVQSWVCCLKCSIG